MVHIFLSLLMFSHLVEAVLLVDLYSAGGVDPLAAPNGGMTPEERELKQKEWEEELNKVLY